jgi:hypothetical protein
MKIIRTLVRDLHATHPDDYTAPCFDVLVEFADGSLHYTCDLFDTRGRADAAAALLAGDADALCLDPMTEESTSPNVGEQS